MAIILKILAIILFNVNFLKSQVLRFEETKELVLRHKRLHNAPDDEALISPRRIDW